MMRIWCFWELKQERQLKEEREQNRAETPKKQIITSPGACDSSLAPAKGCVPADNRQPCSELHMPQGM